MFSIITESGFWNPIIWVLSFIVIFLIMYILRSFGNNKFKKQGEKTKVFLSGNPEYASDDMHIKSSNLYWGFTKVLDWVYTVLKRMHNGDVRDYILWFVIIMGTLLLLGVML